MVKGPLRVVLWILGSLGVVWVVLSLWTVAWMGTGGMMDGMMGGGTGGMTGGGPEAPGGAGLPMTGGMGAMMGMMLIQTLGMLGLAGIFVYLVVDSIRDGDTSRSGPGTGDER